MNTYTPGQLLLEQVLPEDLKHYALKELSAKGIKELFQELATKHPDEYRDVAHKLMTVSRDAMYHSGGYSFGLKHMLSARSFQPIRAHIRKEVEKIVMNPNLSEEDKDKKIISLTQSFQPSAIKSTMDESIAEDNPLAKQISSGSKGKPFNLASLRAGDMLYQDHLGRDIAVPILKSYSEGLNPAEYWAGSYGARKGVLDLKGATRDAGYFGKQLTQAAHRLVVTTDDYDVDEAHPRGLPVKTEDPDNEGAFLAHTTGPYKRNTLLTPKTLAHLKSMGHDAILVRSPMVGGPPDGGVASYDVGVRERGVPAPIGDFVGISAAMSSSEAVSQSQISSKHTGGVSGQSGGVAGFPLMDALVQVPKTFPGGAAHSQKDGRVTRIDKAPAGGHDIYVDGIKHYASIGLNPIVSTNQEIEAGDPLSEGQLNPAEIVKHKGVGEGRRAFVDLFVQAAKAAGFSPHRRNIELVARGLIDHVRLHDSVGDYIPNDIVPYHTLEHIYEPREDAKVSAPSAALNHYLEKPALHYSIGTKIRPSVVKTLNQYGVDKIVTHHEEPPFEPVMVRGMENLTHDPDWMTKMLGSNLEKGLLKSVHRGSVSDEHGTSYVPSLARGVDFGKKAPIKGWDPNKLIKSYAGSEN